MRTAWRVLWSTWQPVTSASPPSPNSTPAWPTGPSHLAVARQFAALQGAQPGFVDQHAMMAALADAAVAQQRIGAIADDHAGMRVALDVAALDRSPGAGPEQQTGRLVAQ